jgi:L-ascorbate metabolism protein UlaG (beta-lactamase superfamily)
VDYILVGHSHYDHVMDVPYIAEKTGAKVIGSESVINVMRAAKLPRTQLQQVEEGDEVQAGDFHVKVIASKHSVDILGGAPFMGEISHRVRLPMKASDYRMGDVYAFLLTVGKTRIYYSGTANLDDDALKGVRADVAILGIANRQNRRHYMRTLLSEIQPDTVIPTYFDIVFRPLKRGLREEPGVEVKKFPREVSRARPGTKAVKLGFLETYRRAIAQ